MYLSFNSSICLSHFISCRLLPVPSLTPTPPFFLSSLLFFSASLPLSLSPSLIRLMQFNLRSHVQTLNMFTIFETITFRSKMNRVSYTYLHTYYSYFCTLLRGFLTCCYSAALTKTKRRTGRKNNRSPLISSVTVFIFL